ncbi:hypothetical protein ACFPAF_03420 [Hymenobacter endophyticus]|uniref:Uncharacterized protein n=1 Tax=Hymenobacter endophyticus TaxID=3076335 RepID=A0ABU3TDI3_9BACT|nr:hypothetical protein [Hymenobacter endophyticus]MDU0369430.1 hypothetical protein [Hymenobacter endophyticus]
MIHIDKFGPAAQTTQQRAHSLNQLVALTASQRTRIPTHVRNLYRRYIVGELSWQEVCELRDAPSALPSFAHFMISPTSSWQAAGVYR